MGYKVFIGLKEVAGYYSNLKKGFSKIGVEASFISLSPNRFEYGGDDEPNIYVNICKKIYNRAYQTNSLAIKLFIFFIAQFCKLPVFLWAILKYDIFIFSSGESFYYVLDLFFFRLLKKTVIITFHGSDARPPYLNGALLRYNLSTQKLYYYTKFMKMKIQYIERYSNIIISHPAYGQFQEKPFISFLKIGIPFFISDSIINRMNKPKGELIILHSPSDPIGKGTNTIRDAIMVLREKGYQFQYKELFGKKNIEVIEELQRCDFIIDQVYSDTPLAGFATEAAYFGKPAVVGGYYSDNILKDLEYEDIPPSLFCNPDSLVPAIEKLISDEKYRNNLGFQAWNFIHKNWTPEKIAKKFQMIIKDEFPEKWLYKPENNTYVYGGGLSKESIKTVIKKMTREYGVRALQISDKPNLQHLFQRYFGEK